MNDIKIDTETNELVFENNDIVLCSGVDQLVQNIKIKLNFFLGEWFLDTTKGLPFFEDILVRNPNFPNIDNIIKANILETDGALELIEYTSSYNKITRTYTIHFKINSIFGEVEFNETSIGV